MIKYLINRLKLGEAGKYSIDDPRTTLIRRQIIARKPFLRKLYEEWYGMLLSRSKKHHSGIVLEIGSGAGFLKELMPNFITSDVLPLKHCDLAYSAEKIPFKDESVDCILVLNALHHIPNCRNFFKEAERILKKGGVLVMIEPTASLWSRFFHKNFHHETCDSKAGWKLKSSGPLSGANIALPWIVFERDRQKFDKLFPSLGIMSIDYHTMFKYALSGGVSVKSLAPGWSFKTITLFERMLRPFSKHLSMFETIEIKKV